MQNARLLADFLDKKGIFFTGGVNAPYLWAKHPCGMTSWEFFNYVLHHAQVVVTPGEGFGAAGAGFFRLSAFASRENTICAINRLDEVL